MVHLDFSKYSLEGNDIWLQRDLMDWCWQLHKDKTVVLIDKNSDGGYITLDKVRLMSFMKFAINALDKMRIEQGKQSRINIKKAKEKSKNKVQQLRLRIKKKKAKTFKVRARIK